jgi:uncharacterized protein YecE (DUF72 family)
MASTVPRRALRTPARTTPEASPARSAGRVLAGTSGFAYAGWSPRFYPAGVRDRDRLSFYARLLPACELNNTFYARPKADRIRAWCTAVPDSFRFIVKAQRGSSIRALYADPAAAVPWLTETLPEFGARLGAVLFRIPSEIGRDDDRLAGLLAAWPASMPLVIEAQHPSWDRDETFAALRAARAVLCTTDHDALETPPDIRRTGPFLYLRLRRSAYDEADLDAWARRLVPFLDDGLDAFVIFRHDEDGASALHAREFAERVARVRDRG